MSAPTPGSTLAGDILAQLGQDFTVPDVDLTDLNYNLPDRENNPRYDAIPDQDISSLTTREVDGDGAFDWIMSTIKAHLGEQYELNRITGDQYAKAYIELTTAASEAAIQFVLQNNQNYWQAVQAQSLARKAEIDAVKAAVELEVTKQQLAAAVQQTKTLQAQHVLTQMQIANEDAKYDLAKAQTVLVETQVDLTQEQIEMTKEQKEAQRGQTSDTRTDGITPVKGMIGKQKDLYEQQVTAYKRDSEAKFGKLLLDGWITQKTMDEGLQAPNQMTNAHLDTLITKMRSNLQLT